MKLHILIIILFPILLSAQSGSLRGRVTDGNSPVPSANIIIEGTSLGTVTDIKGYFEFVTLPVGNVALRVSSVGYKTTVINVSINENRTSEVRITLKEAIIEIDEVEYTADRWQNQSDTRTSVLDLDPRDAKILPGAVEDILRSLQSLPGVLAPNDFSSQLIVRGSGPDQNLIVMDDVEIFNPYRLYGVISMFNPDAVSEVNLVTGGFPAKYGDRLSAVLDVTNREGDKKQNFKGSINASIVQANLVLEGKNPFGINGSWLLNSRRTYYDLIIEPFVKNTGLVDENVSFPNFYDIQAKLVFGPFSGHKFILNGIYSRDGVDVLSAENRKTADSIDVYNISKNDVASFAWHFTPSRKLMNKIVLSWYRNGGATEFDSQILDPSLNRKDFEDIIPDTLAPYLLGFKFNSDYTFQKYSFDDKITFLWKDHILDAGFGVDFMHTNLDFIFQLDPELEAIFEANPQFRAVLSSFRDTKKYNRYHSFIQNNFKISEKLFVQPGLRFDYYNILRKAYLVPRISLSYAFDPLTTLRLVWGVFYQSPGYEKLMDRGTLFDFNEFYTRSLNAERAIHYVFGIERWLNNEWNVKLEGYYKDFTNLLIPEMVQGRTYKTEVIPGRNPRYASAWTNPVSFLDDSLTQIPVNVAFGEAYGLELFLAKKNVSSDNKLSGWISYALAFADRFERGVKYPFRFDQRNTLNLVLNYKVNDWFDFGIRWQYGSGFPFSEAKGIKPRIVLRDTNADGVPDSPFISTRKNSSGIEEVIFDVDFGDSKFTSRFPAYHRLDIRLTLLADYWDLDWTFYLDIINVYNHKNIIGYNYFVSRELTLGRESNSMFPILPTLGFSVKF